MRSTLFIINPDGKSISLVERTRQAANKHATLFLSIHHDSVQRRYVKEWSVGGKTHLYSDNFSGFSVFVSRKNRKFAQSLQFARLLGEAMIARGSLQRCIMPRKFLARAETL